MPYIIEIVRAGSTVEVSKYYSSRFNKKGRGIDCSAYRQELTQSAKAFISAFIEQAMLGGKISPPSGIFLAKNWLGYKDTISIEESIPEQTTERALTAAELPTVEEIKRKKSELLPDLRNETYTE